MHFNDVNPKPALLLLLAASLAGCGGGGGGGAASALIPDSSAPAAIAHPANPGKGFFVTIDAADGAVTASSPAGGSTAAVRATTGWSSISDPASDASLPDDLRAFIAEGGLAGRTLYKRTVRMTLDGGVAGTDQSLTQYALTGCGSPSGTACNYDDQIHATLATYTVDGRKVTDLAPLAAGKPMVSIVGKGVGVEGDQCNAQGVCSSLVHARYGTYGDGSITARLTGVDDDGDLSFDSYSGRLTTGYFYDGVSENSVTAASDMAALKSSKVVANYSGAFEGVLIPSANPMTPQGHTGYDIYGSAAVAADFGSGSVTGQMYGLNGWAEDPASQSHRPFETSYGIQIDGKISGAGYAGTAKYTTGPYLGAPVRTDGGIGEVVGGFYGPNAAETVGVVRIPGGTPGGSTGAPGTITDGVMIGAFGAKKN